MSSFNGSADNRPFTKGTAKTALAWFAAWCLLFGSLGVMSMFMPAAQRQRPLAIIGNELGAAAMWAVLSVVIGAYHNRLRRATTNVFAIVAAHVPGLLIAALIDSAGSRAISRFFNPNAVGVSMVTLVVLYLDFDVIAYIVVIAVSEVAHARRALNARQRQAEQLERSLARARLDYLAAQLQPHFLFNSLGAVSELAYQTPAAAARVLRQLASIFRSALATRDDEITLGEEIVGIEPYLDIQRIRFADWLRIEYRVDDAAVDCLVPRFVLQPLVENAIRHGLSGRHAAGTIEISAAVQDRELVVCVADDGVGLEASSANAGRGIGLANVRDRLAILYGGAHDLRLASAANGGAIAELRIPARRRSHSRDERTARRALDDVGDEVPSVRVPAVLRNPVISQIVVWTIGGLLWTQQSFTYFQLRGRLGNLTWLAVAKNDMPMAVIWALLAPAILFVARRFPIRRNGFAWRVGVYAIAALVVDIAQLRLWQFVVRSHTPLLSNDNEMPLIVGMLIYVALVALAHRGLLLEWMRARDESAAALRTELDEAQERAMKLQSIPPVLLASLEAISHTAQRDPGLTERQLTRLGDYLRLALECTDALGITPERQRALDASVTELRRLMTIQLAVTA
ncbi:MAG TPA: sensor histidine kinase [Gemmatimonadaceae bacterium]|nr:sensor histidine kinase [Gemmatimonadaceae bacterium]